MTGITGNGGDNAPLYSMGKHIVRNIEINPAVASALNSHGKAAVLAVLRRMWLENDMKMFQVFRVPCCDDDCIPSETLVAQTGLVNATVGNALSELRGMGLIHTYTSHRKRFYTFNEGVYSQFIKVCEDIYSEEIESGM